MFRPNTESTNRLERLAGYALEKEDHELVQECREQFEQRGEPGDDYHE
jgi:hypothetical protein